MTLTSPLTLEASPPIELVVMFPATVVTLPVMD
jgi:hypothetical protein